MKILSMIGKILAVLSLPLGVMPASVSAQEDAVAAFFKGKQITLYIASAVGGGYDAYARMLARRIGTYIPGHPGVVPANMPGAGGSIVINHLLNASARDGTVIAALEPGSITAPLYSDKIGYDARKLIFVGSANREVDGCWIRSDSPIKSYQTVFEKDLVIGAAAPGGTTFDLPTAQNNILGTKFKIVSGYSGNREILLAMERNEVQGICGSGMPAMMALKPDLVTGGFVRMIVQENSEGSAALNSQNIPRASDFARTANDRQALDLIFAPQKFGRPFALPPSVPADRVAAIRRAFVLALQDPELLAEAKKLVLDIDVLTGEDFQKTVEDLYHTPKAVIDLATQALHASGAK